MRARQTAIYLTVIILVFAGLFVGAAGLSVKEVLDGLVDANSKWHGLVVDIRLPRSIGAVVIGCALAVAGLALQAVYRNRLTEPFLLGISSAAGLGFVVGSLASMTGQGPVIPVLAAVAAGLLASYATRIAARFTNSRESLILLGVALGFVILAVTLVITFAANSPRLPTFAYFIFGSLSTVTWRVLAVASPVIVIAIGLIATRARPLDILAIGDDQATSLGVDVSRLSGSVLAAAGAAAGASVGVAGVVGFVGLAAPILARRLFTGFHRILLPTAAAIGAVLVLVCDLLIRGMFGTVEVPLGVMTAVIGGPILVVLLLKRSHL